MDRSGLRDHVFGTYVSLRYGMAIIGAALPFLVYGIGALNGVELQGSMSAYYWAPDGRNAPARDWFVGCLFAVAACLYLYKGFTIRENVALNLAGLFAAGVAVFPTEWDCKVDCGRFSTHGASAVLMFLCLAYVVWFRARDTLSLLPKESADRYLRIYRLIALVMLGSPLTAFVMNSILGRGKAYIFFVEAAGIEGFAAYWFVKISEFKKTNATRRALRGAMETTPHGTAVPAPEGAPPPPESSAAG